MPVRVAPVSGTAPPWIRSEGFHSFHPNPCETRGRRNNSSSGSGHMVSGSTGAVSLSKMKLRETNMLETIRQDQQLDTKLSRGWAFEERRARQAAATMESVSGKWLHECSVRRAAGSLLRSNDAVPAREHAMLFDLACNSTLSATRKVNTASP